MFVVVFGEICFIEILCEVLEKCLFVNNVILVFNFILVIVDVGVNIFGILGLFFGFL